ncbi:O-antigen ligase family protein [Vicingaceae bacterium]|nr:O-antigen ligase family protein [Vicingaceae bacterium]
MANDFYKTGAFKIYNIWFLILLFTSVLFIGVKMANNPMISYMIIGLAIGIFFLLLVYKIPRIGMYSLLIFTFFVIGFTRLIPLKLGLGVDSLLLLMWIILFFKGFQKANWSIKNNLLTYCALIWVIYIFIQLYNPEAVSKEAWFYASRNMAFYPLMLIPLVFLICNQQYDVKIFIKIWCVLSILFALYGVKQYYFGLYSFEWAWLAKGAHKNHVFWGVLKRMFSFSSDANQFGQCMAHSGLVFTVLIFKEKKISLIILYATTAILSFWGMMISGTRGAIMVPLIGFTVYFVLYKNIKVLIAGALVGGFVLYLLAFTFFLHSLEPVRRMRTAFNPTKDESFIVRIENKKRLSAYLADKPFGGGIGSSGGYFGRRFGKGSYLSNVETDGLYVRLHAEAGIIGLYLFVILHILSVGKMVLIVWKLKNPHIKNTMNALTVGVIGLLAANYSSDVTILLPANFLLMFSMVIVYLSPKWDKGEEYPEFIDKYSCFKKPKKLFFYKNEE